MSKVKLLSPELISKIAAGEVIERPASVVKELLENAFDADADSIEIVLKDAGRTLISIKDNGSGIEKEDIGNIFKRHATSKISSAEDLFDIRSLGFRGEALYSIAAIGDVILRSKTEGQDSGWEIHLRGGEASDLKPCTMNTGTEIEVRELFFNTPARRKFLKADTAELSQVINLITPYTLLYPDCRFLLKHQNKTLLDLKKDKTKIQRAVNALKLNEEFIFDTDHTLADSGLSIHMVLGDMNIKRSRRDMQFVFVNGRPVNSQNISFHMNQIYQLVFPPKVYPFFAVFIKLPAEEVDVNIHPAKREVKIKNEYKLASILRHMCEHALMTSSQAQKVTSHQPPATSNNSIEKALKRSPSSRFDIEPTSDNRYQSSSEQYSFPTKTDRPVSQEAQHTLFTQQKDSLQSKLKRARFVGSFINKFLLFEADQSLFVVDQHAAQERIMFEKLKTQMENGKVEVQNLLSPILIKLSVQEYNNWESTKDELARFGLATTAFDDETVAIQTTPVLLKDPETALHQMLAGEKISHTDHAAVARRACRSSIMAGDSMNKEKAEHQRNELIQCRDPFTCPHGRPTVIEMQESFLDKQFLRT